jgi:hypothetical protein
LLSECTECGAPLPEIRKPANWRQAVWGGWTCPECGVEFDRWGRVISGIEAAASDPGGLAVSDGKLRVLRPDLYGVSGLVHRLREKFGLAWPQTQYLRTHLKNGDTRAAVVVATDPLLVAAYTDEIDCVAMLAFPDSFVDAYDLKVGSRLLTVNTYNRVEGLDADLFPGDESKPNWTGFHPIIAEFVSDDMQAIEERKRKISDAEWQRTKRMGCAYLTEHPGLARDGRPVLASLPAK